MFPSLRQAVHFVLFMALAPAAAHAQYGRYTYPSGYGGYGWGGWGGASTVQGNMAQGLGNLAVGTGILREQTAQANAINANTAAQINQYMYLSQLEANRRYHERQIKQQKLVNVTADSVQKRLRDNPTPRDVTSGDALNVVLDDLNNPKVYVKALQGAKMKLPGAVIRDIPFQHAASAITVSVDELTKAGPPPSIKNNPAFNAQRAEMRKTVQQLREEQEEKGQYDPETLHKLQSQLEAAWGRVQEVYPKNSKERNEAGKYIKAAYGLSKMLETPAVDVLLSGVEKRPDTTVGDLLGFMKTFNLRFGPAKNDRQRTIYNDLYPVLVKLRDETAGTGQVDSGPVLNHAAPGEFFEGMQFQNLSGDKVPPPPPAGPK